MRKLPEEQALPWLSAMPAALGFAAALEAGGLDAGWQTSGEERRVFREALVDMAGHAQGTGRCDYILSVTHPTMGAQALLIRLDALGFAVSAGSACSSGSLKPSRVLKAFGVDEEVARRTIRVSFGWTTTRAEVERFCDAWLGMAREAAERAA